LHVAGGVPYLARRITSSIDSAGQHAVRSFSAALFDTSFHEASSSIFFRFFFKAGCRGEASSELRHALSFFSGY
jgi:hypothetical protein